MKTTHILPALVAGTLLTACGGGTTTSSSTTGGTTTPPTSGMDTTLADANSVYTGSRSLALLNTANSMAFVNLVLGTENINDNITAPQRPADASTSAATSTAQANLLQSQRILSSLAAQHIAAQRYQARAVNESEACPNGGTATLTGNVDDATFTGTLQVTYNQCKSENVVTNGSALLVVHAVNVAYATPTSYTLSMKGVGVRVDDVPYTATGTLRTDLNVATGQSTLLVNQYQRNLSTGKQQLAETVKMVVESSGYTDINGKFCEGVQGCVTASTVKAFMFAADGVPIEGELALTGAANSKVQVIAQGYDTSTPPQRKLQVNLDSNGDGVYESPSVRNESVLKNFSVSTNTAPTAVATLPQAITLGTTITLDGSKTTDPDGDFLAYQWTLESAPQGSTAALVAANTTTASFTPDTQGTYTFSLKVTDALGNTNVASKNITVMATANPLSGNVIDAAYNNATDQLLTVSSQPSNTLNLINPTSGRQQTIALKLPPTSLALSADGKTAVVGHNGAISHIDVEMGEVINFYGNLGFNVYDVALGNNGKAYATPPAGMQWSYLYVIDLASGKVQEDNGTQRLFGGAHLQAVPSLKAVYTLDTGFESNDLNRYDTSAAQPNWLYDSPYQGQYDVGAANSNLWSTDDGMYLLTAGGSLFQIAAQKDADMRYQRTVADDDDKPATYLLHADHSQKAAKFVAIEAAESYRLKTYTMPLLNLDNSLSLQGLSIDGSSTVVKPSFVFFNADGTERYSVLEQGSKSYVMAF